MIKDDVSEIKYWIIINSNLSGISGVYHISFLSDWCTYTSTFDSYYIRLSVAIAIKTHMELVDKFNDEL